MLFRHRWWGEDTNFFTSANNKTWQLRCTVKDTMLKALSIRWSWPSSLMHCEENAPFFVGVVIVPKLCVVVGSESLAHACYGQVVHHRCAMLCVFNATAPIYLILRAFSCTCEITFCRNDTFTGTTKHPVFYYTHLAKSLCLLMHLQSFSYAWCLSWVVWS